MWQQRKLTLKARSRGFHLITDEVARQLPELAQYQVGVLHLFIQHTSASLSINENADATVRQDMQAFSERLVPDSTPYFQHTYEGQDDMPAHVLASLFGNHLAIPINQGRLALGTWQGIYLGEHRFDAGSRNLVATLQGDISD